jgi:hypothetical protein
MRSWMAGLALVLGLALTQEGLAHHGWGWASEQEFELTGKIAKVRLGNPHGEVTLDVAGEQWVVEVGQSWRNEQSGLTPELLSIGRVMTAHGPRPSLVQAERAADEGRAGRHRRQELQPLSGPTVLNRPQTPA